MFCDGCLYWMRSVGLSLNISLFSVLLFSIAYAYALQRYIGRKRRQLDPKAVDRMIQSADDGVIQRKRLISLSALQNYTFYSDVLLAFPGEDGPSGRPEDRQPATFRIAHRLSECGPSQAQPVEMEAVLGGEAPAGPSGAASGTGSSAASSSSSVRFGQLQH